MTRPDDFTQDTPTLPEQQVVATGPATFDAALRGITKGAKGAKVDERRADSRIVSRGKKGRELPPGTRCR